MEQVRSSLEQTEKGKVSNAAANYKRVFQLDPLLKGAIRKNLLTERVDIVKPLGWYRDSPTLTDVDIKYLLLYFEENYGLTIEKKIQDAVMVIANENRYHPVRDFLNALQWDGIERIRYCLHRFLGADADDYTCEAMRLFLLGAISRAFRPGCKFEIMLCLVGGQGAGKSSFFRLLAVQDDWFSDDLKKLDDENVYRKMNINEKKALYAFGCPNREATVQRLRLVAALAPDPAAKKLFFALAVKLNDKDCDRWYRCFFYNMRVEMERFAHHKYVPDSYPVPIMEGLYE